MKQGLSVLSLFLTCLQLSLGQVILSTDYDEQKGTGSSGTTVGWFDANDFTKYNSLDFGTGDKVLKLNYAKGNDGGKLAIKVDDEEVRRVSLAKTGGWSVENTAVINFPTELTGLHNLTLAGIEGGGILNIISFEISDLPERSAPLISVPATQFSNQWGTQIYGDKIGSLGDNDFLTYDKLNFGPVGTTKGIKLTYSKGNDNGLVEVKLGNSTGTNIATFSPIRTTSWSESNIMYIPFDDETQVSGINSLTFLPKQNNAVMNLISFELIDFSERNTPYEPVLAREVSTQFGIRVVSDGGIGYFDNGDYLKYSKINYGQSAKSIKITYAKNNRGGRIEIRKGGVDGEIIAEYSPVSTGDWSAFVTVQMPIKESSGVDDLTIVGRDVGGVLDLMSFELSDQTYFKVDTRYRIDNVDGVDIQCNYGTVLPAFSSQVYDNLVTKATSPELEIQSYLNVASTEAAVTAVKELCTAAQNAASKIPFSQFTAEQGGDEFVKLFYSGRGSWNEETQTLLYPGNETVPANDVKVDAAIVKEYYEYYAKSSAFETPDLPQFDPALCASHAVMCCWPRDRTDDNDGNCDSPYDEKCVDKDVADNTDVCYNELDQAPYANGITANGFSVYGNEGPVHCHGFAWANDEQEVTSRYKGNALFFVSMYDHLYKRGYVEDVPGSPSCGCVESMPRATQADCTQTNVEEEYVFVTNADTGSLEASIDTIEVAFEACQASENNDLEAFVEQLAIDEKITAAEIETFSQYIVGDNNCPSATESLFESKGLVSGFNIDTDRFTYIIGEGFDVTATGRKLEVLSSEKFEDLVKQLDAPIVRRVCPSCKSTHKDIYYRRLNSSDPLPEGFDLLNTLMNNWPAAHNVYGVDYALYSSFMDAYFDTKKWEACDENVDSNVGFPGNCGPKRFESGQWNSYVRDGGTNYHAFLVPIDPSYTSTVSLAVHPEVFGSDRIIQEDTHSLGNMVTHFDANDYVTYGELDFGAAGFTKAIELTYSKGNDGGKLAILLDGPDGRVLNEVTLAHTGGWSSSTLNTAVIGIPEDVSGHHTLTFKGIEGGGILNLEKFKLSGLESRAEPYGAVLAREFETTTRIRVVSDGGIGYFDNGDYLKYSKINYGQSAKSIKITYAKNNRGGRIEIRKGGIDGEIIAEYSPVSTGDWSAFVTVQMPIKESSGVDDLTIVGRDVGGVLDLMSFELSDQTYFKVDTRYRIDNVDGVDIQCNYGTVLPAFSSQVYDNLVTKATSPELEIQSYLNVASTEAAVTAVKELCTAAQNAASKIPFSQFTAEQGGDEFVKLFYSGRGSWNEETQTLLYPGNETVPANDVKVDAAIVKEYYEYYAKSSAFETPDLPQFDPALCASHAVMCCWPRDRTDDNDGNCDSPYDEKCVDKDVADNTDVCYNELDQAPYANGITANGFSVYGNEGPVHCHGFAWANDEQEVTSRYKGNALFFVSMYDHLYKRGYVEDVPGSPSCGCVESMPRATQADCTQTNVEEEYVFVTNADTGSLEASIDTIEVAFEACQASENNDLEAFVEQLAIDEKITAAEIETFSQYIVGDNNCPSATESLFESKGLVSGFNIDTDRFTYIIGEGFDVTATGRKLEVLSSEKFEDLVKQLDAPIVRRVCPSCKSTHKDIYYRRLNSSDPLPEGFDLLNTLMNNWPAAHNVYGVDYALYSSFMDAYFDTKKWEACDENVDSNVGFPGNCGPKRFESGQWNSYVRDGGTNYHAFLVPIDPSYTSTVSLAVHPEVFGSDRIIQEDTHSLGNMVTHFDANDYVTYGELDFGAAGFTKAIELTYSKGNDGGKLAILLDGPDGRVLNEVTLAHTGGWSSSTLNTAVIGIPEDVSGHHTLTFKGIEGGGILNLEKFKLSGLESRAEPYGAVLAREFETTTRIRVVSDGGIGYFDNGDYLKYSKINYGQSAKSIKITYAKNNRGGRIEIRKGGIDGEIIAEYSPVSTGDWSAFVTVQMPIKESSGVDDLTIVGRDVGGVLDLMSFELSDQTYFKVDTRYRIDNVDGVDIQCNYGTVLPAFSSQVYDNLVTKATSPELEIQSYLNVASTEAAVTAVKELCTAAQNAASKIPFSQFTAEQGGDEFVKLFYSGRGSWNEETQTLLYPGNETVPANDVKVDAAIVKEYYEYYAKSSAFETPDLPQFDPALCASHAVMCCWPRDRTDDNDGNCDSPYDEKCVDKDVADNTDVCYNELDQAPYANGITANGFSVYGNEGPVHCHGFAWANDEQEVTSRYKGNALFFVSMYDHLYKRGYVEDVPGSPSCGCVESMPRATQADCTQTNVEEEYVFVTNADTGSLEASIDTIEVAFEACQASENNDLEAFVEQLAIDEKITAAEIETFSQYIVGDNNCPSATESLFESKGLVSGFNIDTDRFTYIIGEGFDVTATGRKLEVLSSEKFEDLVKQLDAPIVRRVCPSCKSTHKDIYYRRLNSSDPLPEGFDLLNTLMNNWPAAHNVYGVDYALYSSFMDAYFDTKKWEACDENVDSNVGFPGNCGPKRFESGQWNSYVRDGGTNYHAFLVPIDPSYTSTVSLAVHPEVFGSDRIIQEDTHSLGNMVTHFDANDYVTYGELDFGAAGFTKAIELTYSKGNDGGKLAILLDGPDGRVLNEVTLAHTGGWSSSTLNTAVIGIPEDVSGHHTLTFKGIEGSGILNLEKFKLSGLESRAEPYGAVLAREFETTTRIRVVSDGGIGYFDNGDYLKYSKINYGQSAKSIKITYAKNNRGGRIEIRKGGVDGEIIAEYSPVSTGDWSAFVTIQMPIKESSGVDDLTIVGRDVGGVLDLMSFELSDQTYFKVDTRYRIDNVDGVDIQCNYGTVLPAFSSQVYDNLVTKATSPELEIQSYLNVASTEAAVTAVKELCTAAQNAASKIPFSQFTAEQGGDEFVKLFYSGRGSWNEETQTLLYPGNETVPANDVKVDAAIVKEYYEYYAKSSAFETPDLPQFDPALCASHAVMCCWPRDRTDDNDGNCDSPYDEKCVDKDVADNTDVCYNELDQDPYANGITANGFSVYGNEGPVHCHGFAWANDEQEVTSRYKGNALFFVSMYDHLYKRGYVEDVPGSPSCGCVESMPRATQADCTQTNVEEEYVFVTNADTGSLEASIDTIEVAFEACQASENNDLEAFVEQLAIDEKITAAEIETFSQYIVGDNNCPSATESLFESKGLVSGFNIDTDRFTYIIGEGFDVTATGRKLEVLSSEKFEDLVKQLDAPIVRRVCPSCKSTHKDIYYRRLNSSDPLPEGFDLLNTLMNNWPAAHNVYGVDYALYSSFMDAYFDTKKWEACDENVDSNVGFPGNCGPKRFESGQWNSYVRDGGTNYHAFLVPIDPSYTSTVSLVVHPEVFGSDRIIQEDTHSLGNMVTHFDANDYVTYGELDFGAAGFTKAIELTYSKGNDGGKLAILLDGPDGRVLNEVTLAHTGGWSSSTLNTAVIGIPEDVSGHHTLTFKGIEGGGILNLEKFKLSGLESRAEPYGAVLAREFETTTRIRVVSDGGIGYFDNGDYLKYSKINYGQSAKSIKITYAKNNRGGRIEIRKGGIDGEIIAEYSPVSTGDWSAFVTVQMPIKESSGVDDLTIVGRDVGGVLDLMSFELSDQTYFKVDTRYRIDNVDGVDIQCNYGTVLPAFSSQVYDNLVTKATSPELEIQSYLNVASTEAAVTAVKELCTAAQNAASKIPFSQFTAEQGGDEFVKLFYSGRGSWNEETQTLLYPGNETVPANDVKVDAAIVKEYYEYYAKSSAFETPDLPQFDPALCASHAAMCCWPRDRTDDNDGNCDSPYDEKCVDKDVADNTDVCYNELDQAPYANGITANGFSVYGNEGPVHCHGFAWANDEQEVTSRYKGNALFFVSMYDHLYKRGYVEDVPGSPSCGCVESMPRATQADCTQTNVEEEYVFVTNADTGSLEASIDTIEVAFEACQASENNDLEAFVEQLAIDEKITAAEIETFSQYIVGDNNCPSATESLFESKGLVSGFNIDTDRFTYIIGEGFDVTATGRKLEVLSSEKFEDLVKQLDAPIVRRVCPSCKSTHKDIYYRRLNSSDPLPEGFDLLNTLMNNWPAAHNVYGVDYALYSSFMDAYFDTKKWEACDENVDSNVGFPGNCGPKRFESGQWNSYVRDGGTNYHAFLVPIDPSYTSTVSLAVHPEVFGSDRIIQEDTHSLGNMVTHFDANDYVTYGELDFGAAGFTKAIELTYSKGNDGGKLAILLDGPDGRVLNEVTLAHTGGWSSSTLNTAVIGIPEDVSGHHTLTFKGIEGGGILNLEKFKLSGLESRAEPYGAVLAREFETTTRIRVVSDGGIGYFDNGDYLKYSKINYGQSAKSIKITYAKNNRGGRIEIRKGGIDGEIIAEYSPVSTGDWSAFVTVQMPIKESSGVDDLTIVGRDVGGVLDLMSFELSDQTYFKVDTRYRIDNVDGVDIQCNYGTVLPAFSSQVYDNLVTKATSPELEIQSYLNVASTEAAVTAVKELCTAAQNAASKIPFSQFTAEQGGDEFVKLFYSGRGSWNEETQTLLYPGNETVPANDVKVDAAIVKEYYEYYAKSSAFETPDLPQFDPALCASHAAMCCWPRDRTDDNDGNCDSPYDEKCVDKDVADNTDVCYNELDQAPYANGITANGFSVYGNEGPVHCHGFAWANDEQEVTSRYKGNALFFVSMYDHLYKRGYVEDVPGSPSCGCVESMPRATQADCTQTNVEEEYVFVTNADTGSLEASIDTIEVAFEACQASENNDLEAFVEQLAIDEKITAAEIETFSQYIVGDNNCPSATESLFESKGLVSGFNIDTDRFTYIIGEGFDVTATGRKLEVLSSEKFEDLVKQLDAPIVRRVCPSCKSTHKDIYYRRLNSSDPLPEGFDLLNTLMNNWPAAHNVYGVDYALYSSFMDAYFDTKKWEACDENVDSNVGFPGNCGPKRFESGQWNSYVRDGGTNYHAFLVPIDPSYTSTVSLAVHPEVFGSDRIIQEDTHSLGNMVTHFDANDYVTYGELDFGAAGFTKAIELTYSKGNDDGKLAILLDGPDGRVLNEVTLAHTGGWSSSTLNTAVIGIPEDVSGHHTLTFKGIEGGGILNLEKFKLSGLESRAEPYGAVLAREFETTTRIRVVSDGGIGYFDNGDYLKYSKINYGQSAKSIKITYAKNNRGGRIEIRKGGVDGEIIAEYSPVSTGDWSAFVTVQMPIKESSGVDDLTIVGRDVGGVLDLMSFELSDLLP